MDEELDLTKRERLMLRELSADSRTSLSRLASIAKCSPAKAKRLLDRLVERLGIRFTLEVDMSKLGLDEKHVVLIKFGKMPDESFLREFFKDDRYAQDVYMADGDFDLLIFAAADTSNNYIKWETELAVNLSEYMPKLYPSSYVQAHLGYMPLNDSFVNFVEGADKKDMLILQLLNQDSRISYREMGQKLGINEDTIRYRIFRLAKRGIIQRFTIAVQGAGGSIAVFFARYRFDRKTLTDIFPAIRRHDVNETEELPVVNTTPMVVILSGSYRFFVFTFGNTKEEATEYGISWYSRLLKSNSPDIADAVLTKPVKGLIPLRNLDPKQYYRYQWGTKWD